MISKKITQKELIDAGLILLSKQGTAYDRFRGRLMFPLKDVKEHIVGFSGRILTKDEKSAKYMNTSETLNFFIQVIHVALLYQKALVFLLHGFYH